MSTLEYLSIDKQIEKLKSQNLHFKNEAVARVLLEQYGYYNIINGYREPYIFINESGVKQYLDGVTFEQIYNLFIFDRIVGNAVMMEMIDLEGHLKAVVSDIIGSAFGVDHHVYLARNNYRDKPVSNPKFSRNEILCTLMKTARESNKDPIKHYRDNYGIVPPWILFKNTYFSTLINLIRFFKKTEREHLILRLYGNKATANMDSYKNLLSDTLFMCLDYRNRTAHGGRIYNYIPDSTLRPFPGAPIYGGLPQLLFALEQLIYSLPALQIRKAIDAAINQYCNSYPNDEDVKRLGDSIGFNITYRDLVRVNPKTKTIHTDAHCSGAQHLERISLDEALKMGYKLCKKCCPRT